MKKRKNDLLRKLEEWKNIPFIPYTRYPQYKLLGIKFEDDPVSSTSKTQRPKELARAVQILRESLDTVPGEMVLEVGDKLGERGVQLPILLETAAEFLREKLKQNKFQEAQSYEFFTSLYALAFVCIAAL